MFLNVKFKITDADRGTQRACVSVPRLIYFKKFTEVLLNKLIQIDCVYNENIFHKISLN